MIPFDKSVLKANCVLSALGVGLQIAGSICLFAATLGMTKEINRGIKKTIVQELSRQLSEEREETQ